MSLSKLFRPRTLAVSILIFIIAVAAFGYAATNTMNPSGAGYGDQVISGYTIGVPNYTLDNDDPTKVYSVDFTVTGISEAPVALDVRISINGSSYLDDDICTNTSGVIWTCVFSPLVNVEDILALDVVAISNVSTDNDAN